MAFPTGWGRRVKVTIQNGQVSGGSSLTDFPALLTLDTLPSEMFDADGSFPAQNGGGDIRVSSDEAGSSQLSIDVVSFVTDNNPANGFAEIWVNVPSVSNSVDTDFYVWYNTSGTDSQPAVADAFGRDAVWSDYWGVFHMAEDPSGSAPQILDSTGNGHNLTSNGSMVTGDLVAAKIGNGLEFNGSSQYLNSGAAIVSGPPFTLQAWIETTDLVNGKCVVSISDESSIGDQHALIVDDDSTPGTGGDRISAMSRDAGVFHSAISTSGISSGVQAFAVGVWASSSSRIAYKDGGNSGSDGTSLTPSTLTDTDIGRLGDNTPNWEWPGVLDEIRIRGSALSADWIATDYNNQNDPGTFIVDGAPETPGTGVINIVGTASGSSSVVGSIAAANTSGAVSGSSVVDGAVSEADIQGSATGQSSVLGSVANADIVGSSSGDSSVAGLVSEADIIGETSGNSSIDGLVSVADIIGEASGNSIVIGITDAIPTDIKNFDLSPVWNNTAESIPVWNNTAESIPVWNNTAEIEGAFLC